MLQYYLTTELPRKFELVFLASHKDGSRPYKFCVACLGLLRMLGMMLYGGIDIVHIHCGDIVSHYRKYLYFSIARLFGKKIVLHLHGALFIEQAGKAHPFLLKRLAGLYSGADLVICLSESWSRDIGLLFPLSRRRVIHNGIPMPQLAPVCEAQSNDVVVSFLGLIGPRKGIFDLLKVIRRLVDQGSPVLLKIGGNGETERLHREIKNLALQDHVEFLGWVSREAKEQLLRHTDIFALPSYGEGMPMSILEAMSYAIPVISTWVGGIPELVEDGSSGYLVHPGDTDALFARLRLLVDDVSLRRQVGRNARQSAETRHDIHNLAGRIGDIYLGLYSGNDAQYRLTQQHGIMKAK